MLLGLSPFCLAAADTPLGIEPGLTYTGEFARNFSGGLRTGTVYLGLIDLTVRLDAERLFGLENTLVHFHAQRPHGDDPSALAGDAQGVSNIAAPGEWRVFEAWVERTFPAQRASLLAGRWNLNAEFYALDSAGLFLHPSFGIGPEFSQTGRGGPSIFPETAFGARAEWRAPAAVLRGAVLNGVPVAVPRADGSTGPRRRGDGLLYVGEAAWLPPADGDDADLTRSRRTRAGRAALSVERDTKLALGAWRYTGDFERLDGGSPPQRGSSGYYLLGEQVVYRDPEIPGHRLRVFAQYGSGDERVWRFGSYLGIGAVMTAPFAGRPNDEAGVALARARHGTPFLAAEAQAGRVLPRAETSLELTYLVAVSGRLSIQPALQYIRNPSAEPGLRDAAIGLIRFELVL
jgi:porin